MCVLQFYGYRSNKELMFYNYIPLQGRAQKFEKGGAQFPVSVSTENIGEEKDLYVFQRPIYPPKSSADQKEK